MAEELEQYKRVGGGAAMLHQLTKTNTVRAVIVYSVLISVITIIAFDETVPQELLSIFLLIVGSYFNEFTSNKQTSDDIA